MAQIVPPRVDFIDQRTGKISRQWYLFILDIWAQIGGSSGVVPPSGGGTGLTSYTTGDILYASDPSTLSKLSDVATGNALISGGVGTAPSWGKIGLTTHVSGTLPVANGGTNIASYTIGDLIYASGTTTLSKLADVATGNALISGGVGVAPSWGKVSLTTTVSGTLQAAQFPALTGDVTTSAGSLATTLATVNSNVGTFTNATVTVNAKGLVTAASSGSSSAQAYPLVDGSTSSPALIFNSNGDVLLGYT